MKKKVKKIRETFLTHIQHEGMLENFERPVRYLNEILAHIRNI